MEKYDVIIIGGGAAGMFSAVTAARAHLKVLLIEKNNRFGKKLAITGKGRCNLTNDCDDTEFMQNVVRNGKFLFSSISEFSTQDAKRFFISCGVALKTERGKRVFPVSDRAADIVDALARAMKEVRVETVQDEALKLFISEQKVTGVRGKNRIYHAEHVILATGGLSYPVTGSTGDGYRIAETVGHTIMPVSGSLVPIELDSYDFSPLAGLSLKNVSLKLYGTKKKPVYTDFGELMFMSYGISGPIALSCSCHLEEAKGPYTIVLDLKPALDAEKLDARMQRDFQERANETIFSCLRGLLPAQIIPLVLERAELAPSRMVHTIRKEERQKLLHTIKELRFPVRGKRPVEEAIVTRGGIKVSEVNPKTMESKLVSGLYFAGEILDCDAYTGGFNLQIAWATAYAAASSCGNSGNSMV